MASILMWPKYIPNNSYFGMISEGLERKGWKVTDFTYKRAILRKYDILHIHFPTFPFNNKNLLITLGRIGFASSVLIYAKARGKKIVWTVHNLAHHEAFHPELEKRFMSWFTSLVDLSIHLTHRGMDCAFEKFSNLVTRDAVVIPHPHYTILETMARNDAATALGLQSRIPTILFFGQIREYKNVLELIKCFYKRSGDALLLIAGKPANEKLKIKIAEAMHGDNRIELMLYTIPEEQLQLLLAVATLVVLPYKEILNSGAAMFALTHNRPVLVPNKGAMSELQRSVGIQWVRLFKPPLERKHLDDSLIWAENVNDKKPDLSFYNPEKIIEEHNIVFAQQIETRQ